MLRKAIRRHPYLYAMFLPPLLYFLIFHYGPMFGNLIAFQDYKIAKGVWDSPFVGFKHFETFLADPYFWKLFRNTMLLNVYGLLFSFPAPIVLALLLNEIRRQRFKRLVQSIVYLPHFLSTVVICGMIVNFLSFDGIANQLLEALGLAPAQFLIDPSWFRTIYIGSDIWQHVGWGTIIYLAALTGIDPQLYEAAVMDGAGRFRQIVSISIPCILPVITILLLLNIGNFLSVGYEKILLLYNGSTYETADVIQTFVYRRGLLGSDLSYSAAVGMFQSVIAFAMVIGANKLTRKIGGTTLW